MKSHFRSALGLVVLLSFLVGLPSCFKMAPKEDRQDTGTSTADNQVDTYNVGDADTNAPEDSDTGTQSGSDTEADMDVDSDNDIVSIPSVQVGDECFPMCVTTTEGSDPENPDWGYEYGGACVIPGSLTATTNSPCGWGALPPERSGQPGVVVVLDNETGEKTCAPLCTMITDAADDPDGDDWSWEYDTSCVIPGTATAETNLPCTTGEALPSDVPQPGVVIFLKEDNACVTDCVGQYICVANCTYYTDPLQQGANDDALNDDWAWENHTACIIPDTITSHNTACETMRDIPKPNPRPGIMVNADPVENSCLSSKCVPICRFVTEPSDPEVPDWGWEDNASCVLPKTPTATLLPEGDVPRGCKEGEEDVASCRYDYPPRTCRSGKDPVSFLTPPALDASRVVTSHFQTSGAALLDPYGAPFLIRGMNNSHGWYDTCGQYMAYGALDHIAAAGANATRMGWAFASIDQYGPDSGDPAKTVIGTTAALFAEILYRIVALGMVAITAVNDATGQTDASWPLAMAQLYTQPAYKEVLLAYEPYLLIGIANEWNGDAETFFDAYSIAVQHFRSEGINHTLVVTANDWGQGCDALLNHATRLLEIDPLHNLLFDIHLFTYLTYQGAHGGSVEMVAGCLDSLAAAGIPTLVGEFGHEHSGGAVEWETIIERADINNQGYAPWLWFGETEYPVLDLNETWDGPLTEWGESLLPLNGGPRPPSSNSV